MNHLVRFLYRINLVPLTNSIPLLLTMAKAVPPRAAVPSGTVIFIVVRYRIPL